jgi:hypothetical protein
MDYLADGRSGQVPGAEVAEWKARVDRNTRWIPNSSSNRAIALDKLLPSLHLAGAPETDRVNAAR